MADITFTGHVGADAELRFTANGVPVLGVRVCDSKSKPDGNGGWETIAETWFNVSLFGPEAEALAPTVRKGARVKVAGEFYARPYEGRNGPGVSQDVNATGIKVLPSRKTDGQGQGGGWDNQTPAVTAGDAWSGTGNTTGGGGGWNTPSSNEPPF